MSHAPLRRRLGHGALSLLVAATGTTILFAATAGVASAVPDGPEPVCAAGTCTVTFTSTGAVQTFTVPAGVTSITAQVDGAAGGSVVPFGSVVPIAGAGGRTTGTFAVAGGDVLGLVVGGAGVNPGPTDTIATVGGFGGGGDGGATGQVQIAPGSSGGGGSFLFANETLVLVAGGGGGASSGAAGGAGGAAGSDAAAGTAGFLSTGGDPGSLLQNGAGGFGDGSGTAGTGEAISTVALPIGGAGGTALPGPFPFSVGQAGGGGGGGYHAGGGGGAPDNFLIIPANSGSGGGGGAGYAVGTATAVSGQAGVNAGDGAIQLSWADVPQITFTSQAPTDATVGGTTYAVAATGLASTPVTFSVDPATTNGACTVDGSTVSFVHVGTCAIAADQAADATHTIGHAVQSFVVHKASQTITFAPIPSTGHVGDDVTLVATGGASGSAVVLTSGDTSVCTVSGSTLHLVAAGSCTVTASQEGSADFDAAVAVDHTIAVDKIVTATTLGLAPTSPVYGETVTATATVTGATAGAVQFSVDGQDVGDPVDLVAGVASLVLPDGLGAGEHPVVATFVPTNLTKYAGSNDEGALAIAKALTKSEVAVRSDEASVTVEAVAPGSGRPEGTVVFTVGGTAYPAVTLDHGHATLPVPVPTGATVSVEYSGNDDFAASSDSTLREDPTIEAAVTSTSPKTPAGWYHEPVTVTFTCEAGSAPLVGGCPDPVVLSDDGASQGVTKTVLAQDGGIATVSVTGINIDRTDPEVQVIGVADGDRFFATAPEAGCFTSDALSGSQGCVAVREVHGKVVTYHVAAGDNAGNVSNLDVTATVYNYGITDAPYANGVYTVRVGQSYTLVAKHTRRARLVKPVKESKKPTKYGAKFVSTGKRTWALGYTVPTSLKPGKTYNLGIKTGKRHIIKIHVIS